MRSRRLQLALLPVAAGFGMVAEWASWDGQLAEAAGDFAVGCVLITCGVIASDRRPESRIGSLMALSSFAWFAGTLIGPAAYLHRGPLVHLQLSYPSGRLRSRLAGAVVAAAYVDAAVEPLARSDALTIGLGVAVAGTAFWVFAGASGPARKAAGPALAAALAFAAVLVLGAVGRLAGWNIDDAVLSAYDVVVAAVAVVLLWDLLRSRWADAVVTGLVVDLGARADSGTLRERLAHALGDPSLVIAYRLGETGAFVDDAGRAVELPRRGSDRTITPLVDRDEEVAVLVHDDVLLADPQLLESVASAARIAVANAALQAEARSKAAQLEASRRRIVEAADAQRRRIQLELELGAGRRLEAASSHLAGAWARIGNVDAAALPALEAELDHARSDLEEFARGVHPAALTDRGLMAALTQLTERSGVPVEVRGTAGRLPGPVEAALFFVCSEALANVAKHAHATRATIDVRQAGELVEVEVRDDGAGGAAPGRGSGLAGLADRVEALGGTLQVDSPRGRGTRIVAGIPVRR
jgi:signal transduction histidine kinase